MKGIYKGKLNYKKREENNQPIGQIIRQKKVPKNLIKNTGRVERTLILIGYLNDWRTILECADLIKVGRKTIHRYFNMFSQFGFIVEQKHGKRNSYRIKNIIEFFKLNEGHNGR
jgi:hypothetical protein